MKTTSFKGTLVDLACGSGSGSASASASAGQSDTKAPASGAAATAGGSTAGGAGATAGGAASAASTPAASASADRSAAGSECPATANSTLLGLKMDNGQVVRFDLVGNQRAQDGLKNNKGWNKNLAANKPLKVKVSGVLQGDKLIVSSIN
jgi:hypothetical protein